MSTHFLWPRGAATLASWGLLDRLRERGCDPISQITFDVGQVQLVGSPPPVDGVADSYCPRRTVLDALLVESAVEAGAEMMDGVVVSHLLRSDDGRVTGVRGHRRGSSASALSLDGRLVVGADGLHSLVADRVGARRYQEHPALTCVYYSYWSGVTGRAASFHARAGQLVLVWPTNDDLTCVYVAWPADRFRAVKTDVGAAFRRAIASVPGLTERLDAGRREQRFTGTGNLPNLYRQSAGSGWALAGDAGHHKDPSTGMGISDAFLSAELLAEAISSCIDDPAALDNALATYQTRRDGHTANSFELTLRAARVAGISPRLADFYRAAARQQTTVTDVFAVLAGATTASDLYSSQQMASVVASASSGSPHHAAMQP
jgi:flavin-dependent dehydrogenase